MINKYFGEKMKSILITTFLLVMAISSMRAQQTQLFDDRPKITVIGEAVVKVQPDQIIITKRRINFNIYFQGEIICNMLYQIS